MIAYASSSSLRRLAALRHDEVHDNFGQFALQYATADGSIVHQRGRLVHGPAGPVLVYEGDITYIGADGKKYVTKYTADFNGYRVEADHLPKQVTPEPLPEKKV